MRYCKTCSRREDRHNVRHLFIPWLGIPSPRFRSDTCGSSIDCAWGCPGCPDAHDKPTPALVRLFGAEPPTADSAPLCQQELDPRGSE